MKNMNMHEDFQKKMQEAAELYYRQRFEAPVKDVDSFIETYRKNKYKKYRRITGAAAAIVIMVGTCFGVTVNVSPAFAATVSEIPVLRGLANIFTVQEIHEESSVYAVDVKVPAVEGLEDEELQNKINALVQQKVDDVVEDAKYDIQEEKEMWLRLGGKEEDYMIQEIRVDYEVYCLNEDYISFAVFKTETAASAYFDYYYYNYDLKTGEEITLEAVLGEGWADTADMQIRKEIQERSKDPDACFFEGEEGFTGVGDGTWFYINEKGNPVVVFNKYEIAPGYMGTQEFEIKK